MAGLKTGKGLGSLIPGGGGVTPVTNGLAEVPIAAVELNPHQPRTHFDDDSLNELADSIRAVGVLQPLLVRTLRPGAYQLIAGERRLKAAQRAGLAQVPVIVRDATDAASAEQALIENVHREDLSPLEEAAAYQQLIEEMTPPTSNPTIAAKNTLNDETSFFPSPKKFISMVSGSIHTTNP